MYAESKIQKYRETPDGTDLVVHIPRLRLSGMIQHKNIQSAELRFDDGRHISAEQRKKAMQLSGTLRTIPGISRRK